MYLHSPLSTTTPANFLVRCPLLNFHCVQEKYAYQGGWNVFGALLGEMLQFPWIRRINDLSVSRVEELSSDFGINVNLRKWGRESQIVSEKTHPASSMSHPVAWLSDRVCGVSPTRLRNSVGDPMLLLGTYLNKPKMRHVVSEPLKVRASLFEVRLCQIDQLDAAKLKVFQSLRMCKGVRLRGYSCSGTQRMQEIERERERERERVPKCRWQVDPSFSECQLALGAFNALLWGLVESDLGSRVLRLQVGRCNSMLGHPWVVLGPRPQPCCKLGLGLGVMLIT